MALELLKEGHRKALQAVGDLELALRLLRGGQAAQAVAAVKATLVFLEGEQRVHFRQEEEGLFLYLAKVTGEGPLLAMVGEHESYWKAVASLSGLSQEPGDGAELEHLLEHIVSMLKGHIEKEDTAYFPLAEEHLSPRHLKELDEEMGIIAHLG
ncbi:MAG: hemerythrin domain-containing protein [Dehalococcoidia bacterium]|jgi:hemerythrin-like domain-containing protein|nr:hemerythrin domain-containing protein [Dehalococcoidia bacterium]MDP7240299.1 hemerythrin domain-containing protein [Dehalococcoidia bacterium]MDP7469757.1 hemerythrin domain-containing protein [Dehalococcoidia bacterium]